jgi:hypothetical protein
MIRLHLVSVFAMLGVLFMPVPAGVRGECAAVAELLRIELPGQTE